MNFTKINTEKQLSFWTQPLIINDTFKSGDIGVITLAKDQKRFQLIINEKLLAFKFRDQQVESNLLGQLAKNNTNLVEVVQIGHDKSLDLRVLFFNGPIIDLGEVDITLDQITLDSANKSKLGSSFDEVVSNLKRLCCIHASIYEEKENYAVVMLGAGATDELNRITNSEDSKEQSTLTHNMVIFGEGVQLAITQYTSGDLSYLGVKRLVGNSQQNLLRSVHLVKLNLNFVDSPKMLGMLAKLEMAKLEEKEGGYLKVWDKYGDEEGEVLLAKARSVGVIEFNSTHIGENGAIGLYVDRDYRTELSKNECLEAITKDDKLPEYLENLDLSWESHSQEQLLKYQSMKGLNTDISWESSTNKSQEKTVKRDVFNIEKVTKNEIFIKAEQLPADGCRFILSMLGDQIQVDRKMAARASIRNGTCAMPMLGALIEEGGTLVPTRKRPTIKPLTPLIIKKVFPKNAPTPVQKKAIEIALNTPDIAIIQGPPGTGKTTVITAIIERLNQELDKTTGVKGKILVSGYQHDAVENIISRLSVNNLPSIKFGVRSSESGTVSATDLYIEHWGSETATKVRESTPKLKVSEDYLALEKAYRAYVQSPSTREALALIEQANALLITSNKVTLQQRLQSFINELRVELYPENSELLRVIRAIRVRETAFYDDGVARATDAYNQLQELSEGSLSSDDIALLRIAMVWQAPQELGFLPEFRKLKAKLLYHCTPVEELKLPKPRRDIQDVMCEVLVVLRANDKESNPSHLALAEYLNELENNPKGIASAIAEYNLVYAATTQQAEGTAIRKAKVGKKGNLVYDTVIVDEAARTSPRDLMIPMVQAENRIILVGDHRQLPHIVDEDIIQKLEQGDDIDNGTFEEQIKKSMFEYLIRRMKQLEQIDGIPRTITLDAQYRSHPLLGGFASEQFYALHGESYESPLPAEYFIQNLSDIGGKAAIWMSVPEKMGKEQRNEVKSRYRVCEAKSIAERLKIWIDSDEGKGLSFGVISFYKGQVNEVFKALSAPEIGITEHISDEYVIKPDYQMLFDDKGKPIEERLRIGTVDSFQGMEFDVVFLSMVRSQEVSNLKTITPDEINSERKQQSVFGHLMSKNRLCVAMTRQKKALIVVGDAGLIQHEIAQTAVPEMHAFYQLCKSDAQGVIL